MKIQDVDEEDVMKTFELTTANELGTGNFKLRITSIPTGSG